MTHKKPVSCFHCSSTIHITFSFQNKLLSCIKVRSKYTRTVINFFSLWIKWSYWNFCGSVIGEVLFVCLYKRNFSGYGDRQTTEVVVVMFISPVLSYYPVFSSFRLDRVRYQLKIQKLMSAGIFVGHQFRRLRREKLPSFIEKKTFSWNSRRKTSNFEKIIIYLIFLDWTLSNECRPSLFFLVLKNKEDI